MSHPAWVCGLKLLSVRNRLFSTVTPCVGVWIETLQLFIIVFMLVVTPCVGVWIETVVLN